MPLRDNCHFPTGLSAQAVKHYQEVIDAIEQIYPDAEQFVVCVKDKSGRIFWDFSEVYSAMGITEAFQLAYITNMMGITRPGPSQGDVA